VYDMPDEIVVQADGALRIVMLSRPDARNAVNGAMHRGLARLWPRVSADPGVRAVVLTGSGAAFSVGSDDDYRSELGRDHALRSRTIEDGRELVLGMARCRVPVVAAVNGPAVGLGCSLVALSDIVYIAPSAHLSYPSVDDGILADAADLLTWPLHINLTLAKQYALTGAPISAERAVELGLANHVAHGALVEAVHCAESIMTLPPQTVERTRRILNQPIERAVLRALG